MHRFLRSAALLVLTLATTAASADARSDYLDLHRRFAAQVAYARTLGSAPRAASPGVATLLADLVDEQRFLAQPVQWDQLGSVQTICGLARLHIVDYLEYNPVWKPRPKGPADAFGPFADTPLVASNLIAYQQEVTPQLAFFIRCATRAIKIIETTANSAQVAQHLRPGILTLVDQFRWHFIHAANNLANDRLSLANRRQMLAALKSSVPALANALDLQSRLQLDHYLASLRSRVPAEMAQDVQAMITMTNHDDCSAICTF